MPSFLPIAYGPLSIWMKPERGQKLAAYAERTRDLPDLEHRHAGDVRRIAVHVLAVAGDTTADARLPQLPRSTL